MSEELPKTLQESIVQYLVWYVKDPSKLSDESVLEHVLNYGEWSDFQKFIQIKGMKETAQMFTVAAQRERSNYLPKIKYYFSNYFKRHAS